MRVAVVGHAEWVEFLRAPHVPHAGEIVEAQPMFAIPAGGGAVAAVHLARWGARVSFYTAFGDDDIGRRAESELRARGIDVRAAFRGTQRRAITLVDSKRERTIVTIGTRLVPHENDALPWNDLDSCDAVYLTGGDAGAIAHARRARVLVSTSRILSSLRGVRLDALVGSENDPNERYRDGDLDPTPKIVVRTEGERGGYFIENKTTHRWNAIATKITGDTYGAGDTFAAALTFALGEGRSTKDAIEFAAARAAEIVTFEGPYPP